MNFSLLFSKLYPVNPKHTNLQNFFNDNDNCNVKKDIFETELL